jgi:hypothetical protein
METLVCKDAATFREALTRGKSYTLLASNSEKQQVKIQGDNDRVRWYPFYCFAMDGEKLLTVKSYTIDDRIDDPLCDTVEVTLILSDGEHETRRWCYFLTPAYASKIFEIKPMEPLISGRHGMLIPEITEAQIQAAVQYLEANNELEDCTVPLSDS